MEIKLKSIEVWTHLVRRIQGIIGDRSAGNECLCSVLVDLLISDERLNLAHPGFVGLWVELLHLTRPEENDALREVCGAIGDAFKIVTCK